MSSRTFSSSLKRSAFEARIAAAPQTTKKLKNLAGVGNVSAHGAALSRLGNDISTATEPSNAPSRLAESRRKLAIPSLSSMQRSLSAVTNAESDIDTKLAHARRVMHNHFCSYPSATGVYLELQEAKRTIAEHKHVTLGVRKALGESTERESKLKLELEDNEQNEIEVAVHKALEASTERETKLKLEREDSKRSVDEAKALMIKTEKEKKQIKDDKERLGAENEEMKKRLEESTKIDSTLRFENVELKKRLAGSTKENCKSASLLKETKRAVTKERRKMKLSYRRALCQHAMAGGKQATPEHSSHKEADAGTEGSHDGSVEDGDEQDSGQQGPEQEGALSNDLTDGEESEGTSSKSDAPFDDDTDPENDQSDDTDGQSSQDDPSSDERDEANDLHEGSDSSGNDNEEIDDGRPSGKEVSDSSHLIAPGPGVSLAAGMPQQPVAGAEFGSFIPPPQLGTFNITPQPRVLFGGSSVQAGGFGSYSLPHDQHLSNSQPSGAGYGVGENAPASRAVCGTSQDEKSDGDDMKDSDMADALDTSAAIDPERQHRLDRAFDELLASAPSRATSPQDLQSSFGLACRRSSSHSGPSSFGNNAPPTGPKAHRNAGSALQSADGSFPRDEQQSMGPNLRNRGPRGGRPEAANNQQPPTGPKAGVASRFLRFDGNGSISKSGSDGRRGGLRSQSQHLPPPPRNDASGIRIRGAAQNSGGAPVGGAADDPYAQARADEAARRLAAESGRRSARPGPR
ncbi:hypothetical protein LTR37_013390 [Vermiconidia calcicola]|uniref:Uncharacterized protein n=1 Tax=Vermiconidia calcicola TaxID=1690605 RepID=A0ACC3MXY2_9PEZI|nr:hypothetical protein LTR37_013390 [Vermiconidia calcicola]